MLHWVLKHIMAWIWLAVATFIFSCLALGGINALIYGPSSAIPLICMIPFLPGLIFGAILGACQRQALRDHMKWTANRWVIYSALGGALGSTVLMYLSTSAQLTDVRLALSLSVVCVAIGQWFSLRQAVRDAWLWRLTYLSGALSSVSLIYQIGAVPVLELLLRAGLFFLMPALVSGLVIAYLFNKRGYPPDLSTFPHLLLDEADEADRDVVEDQRARNEASSASASASERR